MSKPRSGEIAGRLRAARGYAGLKQPELAAELGISVETLSRMENGKTTIPQGTPAEVARICEVPLTFMEVGFAPLERPVSDAERRLMELEARLHVVEAHHPTPISAGGDDSPANLVALSPADHRLVHDLVDRVNELEAQLVTRRAGAALPAPGGELGRRLRERETTARDHPEPGSGQDRGAQPGNGRS